ncbi:phosphoglucosamine mutase [Methylocella silvestris BL2]|uniref:Phosphoglucosamine mutase n=1 Tax=Methylocella silvestris (strain DSM 15510 / CIP 108128 / LMG 27833 / NCIMB 13906 / BL2) TaxID=395965 RepID=GLMM_METSB|nr:phosphoglucosamine mutase [Methylocella silvestris]B8ER03.1 RecName: Full=Phosphoglucosamine mutase [Methylocella silvestris BL2]ACK49748.1 phosphoglucosamine mutase [Methylocella silvestris BL2]
MPRKHFGTDGIRGQANSVITPELAMKVAQATGVLFQRGEHRHRAVIGKDTRLSSYMIEYAMVAGFASVGVDALLLGPMPTPAVAMLTHSMRADVGVMISASHNSYEDNGIKLFGPDGFKLSDEVETKIETMLDAGFALKLSKPADLGRAMRVEGDRARYIEFAKRTLTRSLSLEGLRIVVDCANGAAYKVAPEALWELGAEVISIGVEPDGFNINRGVGSTSPQALVKKVREMRADIGIALDGDADRVLIVDETGKIVDGDQLMAVIAASWKEDGRLSRPGIVATVMSNLGLERYLESIGLTLARTAVGDRYVLEHMRSEGYNLGGEQSGHIILSDFCTTGDGLVAALQLLAVVKRLEKPVSQVCRRFEPSPQVLRSVRVAAGKPLEDASVARAIDLARKRLAASGRLVIRASGTEPVIRVMGEGDDLDLVESIVNELCDIVASSARAA